MKFCHNSKVGQQAFKMLALCFVMLISFGCAGPEKTPERDDVLEDIRNTTLIPNLGSYDEDVQKRAFDRILISLRKAPQITRNLLAAELDDPFISSRTKRVICMILAGEGDERALPRLVSMLAEGNTVDDNLIEEALLEYGSDAVEPVKTVLMEGNVTARRSAASILLTMKVPVAFDALQDRFTIERDPEVRFLCICGFAEDPRRESLEILARALDDVDEVIRGAAWESLKRRAKVPGDLRFDPMGTPGLRQAQASAIRSWLTGKPGGSRGTTTGEAL